jgi:aerobic carbon-monoxide dehydrogenase small subunit
MTAGDIFITVNGRGQRARIDWAGQSLLGLLRDSLGLTGTKNACEQGECGSCSVKLDGRLVCACLVLAANCSNSSVETIESDRTSRDDGLCAVQRAFHEMGAVQCGFCTPGLVMSIRDLISRSKSEAIDDATIKEAISGNLCRCTGYGRVLAAARAAIEQSR